MFITFVTHDNNVPPVPRHDGTKIQFTHSIQNDSNMFYAVEGNAKASERRRRETERKNFEDELNTSALRLAHAKRNQKEKPQAKTITVRFCPSLECRQTGKQRWTQYSMHFKYKLSLILATHPLFILIPIPYPYASGMSFLSLSLVCVCRQLYVPLSSHLC